MLIFRFSVLPGTVWPIRPWLQGTRLSLFALNNWHVVDRCRHSAETSYYYLRNEIPCDWPWQLKCCTTLESIQPIDEIMSPVDCFFCPALNFWNILRQYIHMQSSHYRLCWLNQITVPHSSPQILQPEVWSWSSPDPPSLRKQPTATCGL